MTRPNTEGPLVHKVLVLGLLLAALITASHSLAAKPADAATTFTVNSILDLEDLNVGDGVCDVITSAGAQCGLGAAGPAVKSPPPPGRRAGRGSGP
jgi:hypothetical protein